MIMNLDCCLSEANGSDVYNHFVKELKLVHFDFLLPDANYNSLPVYSPEKYGQFMVEVFDEWIKENSDNPRVFIRYCINALELFYTHELRDLVKEVHLYCH
ncbi:hypothetical protein [Wolbachia endosymbiont of Pentidionis agamae]|uniref:hypothetical protein n=1 Tax=Wolbachia endosymbiont of Pentidionis agamae TaxID=3110435 RepID=UPI002FD68C06